MCLEQCRDDSIEQRKNELIHATADSVFRKKVFSCAWKLAGNKIDAEDYSQEAITRFISAVKNKKSLEEMERMGLPYIYQILRNIDRDKWRKMHNTAPSKNIRDQVHQTQQEASEELGRQESELLAAELREMSVEDISDWQCEKDQRESTRSGLEEDVISRATVDEFINGLSGKLPELARLIAFEGYRLNELPEILNLPIGELKYMKKCLQKALSRFQQKQI